MRTRRLPHLVPNVTDPLRLTIPAREAIELGNRVERVPDGVLPPGMIVPAYTVELISPPRGIVLCLIGQAMFPGGGWAPEGTQHRGVRLIDEPEYPCEWPPDRDGRSPIGWAEWGEWTPCPTCGHALLWCEAGFVPGWRICLAGHACQLSDDGRSAKRHAKQDASTLRATGPSRDCAGAQTGRLKGRAFRRST